jgi:WD40 repeat protein
MSRNARPQSTSPLCTSWQWRVWSIRASLTAWNRSHGGAITAAEEQGRGVMRLMTVRFLGTVLAGLFLASCGGGGDSGPTQPMISSDAPSGTAGFAYPPYAFTVTSGGTAPFTWTETGALPPGLSLSSAGQLSGTPTTAGTYPITVTVTDSSNPPLNDSIIVNLNIEPPALTINEAPPPTGTVGTTYPAFQFTTTRGALPLVWSETGELPAGLELSVGGVLSGTPQQDGHFPITMDVKDSLNRSAPDVPFTVRVSLARPAAAFTQTLGPMTIGRSGHTATLLLSGQVLIAGGPNASAELYDPTTEMFTATGNMTVARSGHTATLLTDKALTNYGYVLVAAGGSQTAELYDPTTGTFTATGSMVVAQDEPTATLLQNGQVLIAGGGTATAELYDPATGTFTATGSLLMSLSGHTATLLLNGQVLIAGGGTATAELYDPASGKFTATGSMSETRAGHTATLLANGPAPTNGSVLIAGPDNTAEVFDPATGTFSVVGDLLAAAGGSTATLRNDGTVLVAGGYLLQKVYVATQTGCGYYPFHASAAITNLFAPESEGYTATGPLQTARYQPTATLLADGSVLVTGGVLGVAHDGYPRPCGVPNNVSYTTLASAELYK